MPALARHLGGNDRPLRLEHSKLALIDISDSNSLYNVQLEGKLHY